MTTLYQLFCDHCHWRKITEGTDIQELVKLKISPVAKGIPHADPVTGDIITPNPMKSKNKYKCPKCGFVVTPKKITNPQEDVDNQADIEKRIQKRLENDAKEREKQLERERKKQHWLDGSQTSLE
jgi:hypothetical protein